MDSQFDDQPRTIGTLLRDLQSGIFLTVRKIEHGGALQARRLSSGGIQFYWRYTHDEKTDRVVIGAYDPSAPPKSLKPSPKGYSVAAAVEACRVRAQIHREKADEGGYREHVAAERQAAEEIREIEQRKKDKTLWKLLLAYCDHLRGEGRSSHVDARSIFALHVAEAWPDVAVSPAASVTPELVADILRKLFDAGKGRTANKLRAYMRAAFQCALDAKTNPRLPTSFKGYGVQINPAALTKRSAIHDRADKNPLSLEQLQTYWQLIKVIPGTQGAALRLHLLTGGQRIQQLLRVRKQDVAGDHIILLDPKGRNDKSPRRHLVPLLPEATDAVRLLLAEGDYVFSTNGGRTPLSPMTMSNWAKQVSVSIEGFQLKRVRSGIETALAAARVSREIRAQVQSHGIAGVQERHYDGHDYLEEKRAALRLLLQLLEPSAPARRPRGLARGTPPGRIRTTPQ